MTSQCRLTLSTLPPTANRMRSFDRKGNQRRSDKYAAWLEAEGWNLKSQLLGQSKFSTPVYVTMPMRRPTATSDCDNRIKPLGDLLQAIGVVTNDSLIHGWKVWWQDGLPQDVAAEISIFDTFAAWNAIRPDAALRGRAA